MRGRSERHISNRTKLANSKWLLVESSYYNVTLILVRAMDMVDPTSMGEVAYRNRGTRLNEFC